MIKRNTIKNGGIRNKERVGSTYRKYSFDYYRKVQHKLRIEVLNFLGGKCKRCGFTDWRALQIDHIDGGGTKELRASNSHVYWKNIMKLKESEWTKKYQLLCANCNRIKVYENNEFRKPGIYTKHFY